MKEAKNSINDEILKTGNVSKLYEEEKKNFLVKDSCILKKLTFMYTF